ncbi:MAG: L-alanine-DL-glutamate epimerase-like enolase superfamily enzyme [Verrucomicrobiales bacterium]
MSKSTDVSLLSVRLHFIEVKTRVPYKFGQQVLEEITCARASVKVRTADGREAEGWGETPLSVGWVWPTTTLTYSHREDRLKAFSCRLAEAFSGFADSGHPLEVGDAFQKTRLHQLLQEEADQYPGEERLPYLGGLVCLSALDIALYDAFGIVNGIAVFDSFTKEFLNRDLSSYLEPDSDGVSFVGCYPDEFLVGRPDTVPVWHSVGGADPLEASELTGDEPDDGYPILLRDWIRRDGLNCLKIKLPGADAEWDFQRLRAIGAIAREEGVEHLCTDFNCTVEEPEYVNGILDRLKQEDPDTLARILYVEQPFPYDLEANQIDVHSVSQRCTLLMDESAHDWKFVRLGRQLGWTGTALKTCKTLTGAILSLCWSRAHGMDLMVQDLTNPMLAQVPHVLLAAHADTMMGLESNAMQYYPEASAPEAVIHPGLYRRTGGLLDLTTLGNTGFGYRVDEIVRELPEPAVST